MLLNVYKNKNNIPPLQGNYLISALPCHCKPLLSASAPSQPLIPRVFQLFPHFQDVSAPKSVPDPKRCHSRLGDTVGWGAESSSHLSAPSAPAPLTSQLPQPLSALPAPLPQPHPLSPGSRPAQQSLPAPAQALQLPHDLVAVRGLGRLRDPAALSLDHLHRGLAIVQEALEQLWGGKSYRIGAAEPNSALGGVRSLIVAQNRAETRPSPGGWLCLQPQKNYSSIILLCCIVLHYYNHRL